MPYIKYYYNMLKVEGLGNIKLNINYCQLLKEKYVVFQNL